MSEEELQEGGALAGLRARAGRTVVGEEVRDVTLFYILHLRRLPAEERPPGVKWGRRWWCRG